MTGIAKSFEGILSRHVQGDGRGMVARATGHQRGSLEGLRCLQV